MDFSLDSYFKLRRKREIEKQEDDVFYETSIELLTQSPEKRKRRRRASWERNLKMYRCPMDNVLKRLRTFLRYVISYLASYGMYMFCEVR